MKKIWSQGGTSLPCPSWGRPATESHFGTAFANRKELKWVGQNSYLWTTHRELTYSPICHSQRAESENSILSKIILQGSAQYFTKGPKLRRIAYGFGRDYIGFETTIRVFTSRKKIEETFIPVVFQLKGVYVLSPILCVESESTVSLPYVERTQSAYYILIHCAGFFPKKKKTDLKFLGFCFAVSVMNV